MKKIINILFILLFCIGFVSAINITSTNATITTDGLYTVITYTSAGTFTINESLNATVLVVAGGGSGGSALSGGGGAGGLIFNNISLNKAVYNISIGSGGIAPTYTANLRGINGGNSTFYNLTAIGGGGGGNYGTSGEGTLGNGNPGGSGGGGSVHDSSLKTGGASTTSQGFQGGNGKQGNNPYVSGGGGGAGQYGLNASSTNAGNGGLGRQISISGTLTNYSCGGGGGAHASTGIAGNGGCSNAGAGAVTGGATGGTGTSVGGNAIANTGSGGGGSGWSSTQAGNGSSGIVIVRYLTSQVVPTIVFVSPTPANLTATTLFSQRLNITYNFTNQTQSLTDIKLNYTLIGNQSCFQFQNGSCVLFNNSVISISPSNTITNINSTLASWLLTENQIYSFTDLRNESFFNQTHTNYTLIATSNYLAMKLLNVSNNQYNIFELDVTSNVLSRLYVCNSSFNIVNNPNPSTVSYCQELGSINNNSFNHSHNIFSGHNIFPFSIINGKIGGIGIAVTSDMWFIVRGGIASNTKVGYVNIPTLTNSVYSTTNNGNAWTNRDYTIDMHLHQWSNNEFLRYYAQGIFNSSTIISSIVNELIDVPQLNPSPPIITNPFDTIQSTRFLNITYLNASSNSIGTSLSYYNLSLLNSDMSFNRTIVSNNSLNNSYYYDVYSQNLSLGVYYVQVKVVDSFGGSASDEEFFNLTRDSLINVSMFNNTNLLSNWSINVTDFYDNITYMYNSSNNYSIIDTIKGHTYNIFPLPPIEFAYQETNFTVNNVFNNYVFYTVSTNSVNITIRDEDTNAIINQNTSIRFVKQGSALEYNYVSTDGYYFAYGLIAGIYDITFTSIAPLPYSVRTYTLTIPDRSTQILNAFLVTGSFETGFYIKAEDGSVINGASFNVQRLVNSSWVVVDSGLTDVLGYTVFTLKNGNNYKFVISASGFDTREFLFTPYVINAPYTFVLYKSASNPFYNVYDYVSYNYAPKVTTINKSMNLFYLSTSAVNGSLIYTYINCDGVSDNVTGSPTSATALVYVNTTNYSSNKVSCLFEFMFNSTIISFNNTYNIVGIPTNGTSIVDSTKEIKDKVNNVAWLTILSYFIIIIATGLVNVWSNGNKLATGTAICIFIIVFVSIGWIDPLMGGLVAFVGLMLLFMGGTR